MVKIPKHLYGFQGQIIGTNIYMVLNGQNSKVIKLNKSQLEPLFWMKNIFKRHIEVSACFTKGSFNL